MSDQQFTNTPESDTSPGNTRADLPGEPGVGGAGPVDGPTASGVLKPKARVEHMIVARESDEADKLLMEGMIQRSCSLCLEVPGCREMRDAGIDPLTNPQRWGATAERSGRNRWVVLSKSGTLFFYWMGSAASLNTHDGENAFTTKLIAYIRQFQPRHLWVAAFTRLVRNQVLAGQLLRVLIEYKVTIHFPGGKIQPWTPIGGAEWGLHTIFASMERNEIVYRNLMGIIAGSARGLSPFGAATLPVGYIADASGRVGPDPEMLEVVPRVLTILADATLSYRDAAKRIGELGVSRRVIAMGIDRNVADVRDPATVVRSMLKWTELYATGVWVMTRPNPLPGLDVIGTVEVHRESPEDAGHINIAFQWGLPEGGWAPPEVFAMIRQRILADSERSRRGGGSSGARRRKPLAGLGSWSEGGIDSLLDSAGHQTYRLRRRQTVKIEESHSGELGWSDSTVSGDVVARFSCGDLHSAIVDAALAALEGGARGMLERGFVVESEKAYTVVRTDGDAVIADLESDIARELHQYKQAMGNANLVQDPEVAADYRIQSEAAHARKRLLETKLAALAASEGEQPAEPVVRCDAEHVARALAAIASVDGPTDGEVSAALVSVLVDLRIGERTGGGRRLTFSLRLPTESGLLLLGPIEGSVKETDLAHPGIASVGGRDELRHQVDDLLAAGTDVPRICQDLGVSGQYVRHLACELTAPFAMSAHAVTALLSAEMPVLREAVWSTLVDARQFGHRPSEVELRQIIDTAPIPQGTTPEWVLHATQAYLGAERELTSGIWALASGYRAEAVRHTLEAGGTITIDELAARLDNSKTRPQLAALTTYLPAGAGWRPVLERNGVWERIRRWNRLTGANELRCITCPHCGNFATRVLHLPEIPLHLLCSSCHRMPTANSPQFPDAYLELPDPMHRSKVAPTTAPTGAPRGRPKPRRTQPSEQTTESAVADYRAGVQILGADGICERHDITTKRLYNLLDQAGIPRRAPRNASR